MRDQLPWLCQGDIFAKAPVVEVAVTTSGALQATVKDGPAVLLTHDCDMDKPNRAGGPRIERFQFTRLRAVDSLPRDRQQTLRSTRQGIPPYEVLYLGEIENFGESFILFSDPYYIPMAYLQPAFREYEGDSAQEAGSYLTAQKNDTRIGRIDSLQLTLMRQKMAAFWARIVEDRS